MNDVDDDEEEEEELLLLFPGKPPVAYELRTK